MDQDNFYIGFAQYQESAFQGLFQRYTLFLSWICTIGNRLYVIPVIRKYIYFFRVSLLEERIKTIYDRGKTVQFEVIRVGEDWLYLQVPWSRILGVEATRFSCCNAENSYGGK